MCQPDYETIDIVSQPAIIEEMPQLCEGYYYL